MYRQYENPRELEFSLEMAERRLAILVQTGADEDKCLDAYNDVQDLKARVNHAWMDEEADLEEVW
jgi:hypothetical protein